MTTKQKYCALWCINWFLLLPAASQSTTTITQYGITWTFDKYYEYGQFANGDYWVIGPVNIIDINPHTFTNDSAHIMNGSMINPSPRNGSNQGYDNKAPFLTYVDSMNAAWNVSPSNPLVLQPNTSLISSISVTTAGSRPQLSDAAILTVLGSAPADGSFRPPYCGTDKTIHYNKSQLNYSLLKKLAPVSDAPTLTAMTGLFERPWIDHISGWNGEYLHPQNNMPHYGREVATLIGEGALMLHLNYSDAEKGKLLIRYVQLGIDFYGVLQNGGDWFGEGGFGGGRKWPILFAGLMLNDDGMKSIGQKSGDYFYSSGHNMENLISDYIHFGEDDQTFYVTQEDVDLTNSDKWLPDSRDVAVGKMAPYTFAYIGMPEWGITHVRITWGDHDNRHWQAGYRECCTANAWSGFVLAAWIMNADDNTINLWNHPALFDYMDRYMAIEKGDSDPFGYAVPGEDAVSWHRSWSRFSANMWDTYRANYGPIGITPYTATIPPFHLHPNPFNPIKGEKLVFTSLIQNSLISLYTINGQLIRTIRNENDGIVYWDGKDSSGKIVVSGMYIYKIVDVRGNHRNGKIVVINSN